MIYRLLFTFLLLLATGCWGEEFQGEGYFEDPEAGGSAGASTSTTDSSTGGEASDGTTTSVAPKTTTDGSTTTDGVAGDGGAGSSTEGGSGGEGGSPCAPPEDIPPLVLEVLETTGSGCDTQGSVAPMTCMEETGCGVVDLVHDAELIEDDGPLRIRLSYQPWTATLPMHVACAMTEPLDCDFEIGHRYEDQVYYVELRETEAGYEVARFYNYQDEDDPDRPGVRQLTMTLTSKDYNPNSCTTLGGTSNVMSQFWLAYVDWVKSLQWEC